MNQSSLPSYDLVIFGATSFVGKLVVDYMSEAAFSLLEGAGTPGVGTPAILGEVYVERLRNAGMGVSGH
ncbi:hypothetical protein CATYP_08185 [Corynebacterium atypicum]|uniref:Uncharacterized protein n=1 Tax=Corynebacterium atypicum TaxID=191610 RepID=A0ABN4DGD4_9CORY|nr:hypothetical protein [Corynebacterium atypicum]AIG64566.1 hypothetical protein CATYP_08185 [Corynebacterium atypicum]